MLSGSAAGRSDSRVGDHSTLVETDGPDALKRAKAAWTNKMTRSAARAKIPSEYQSDIEYRKRQWLFVGEAVRARSDEWPCERASGGVTKRHGRRHSGYAVR